MGRRTNEAKPGYAQPGYEVTRTDEFEYDPSPEGDNVAVLIRRRCSACKGEARTETVEYKSWAGGIAARNERGRRARRAIAVGQPLCETELKSQAEKEFGSAPDPKWEPCPACEGRGFYESELGIRALARLLIDLLRISVGKKGKARLKVKPAPRRL